MEIRPADLEIEFYRASGPGGQHRNTTMSAVRIRHLPTGIVVHADENRSQHRNRQIAMERLERILAARQRKRKVRIGTKVPEGTRRERLKTKRVRGLLKKGRRPPAGGDDH